MLRDEPGQPHVDPKVDVDKLDREEINRLLTWESRDYGRDLRSPDLRGSGTSQPPGQQTGESESFIHRCCVIVCLVANVETFIIKSCQNQVFTCI